MSTTGSRTPSKRRNTALLGIAAVVLMAVVGVSYREWRQYSRTIANAAQTRAIADSVDRLLASLLDAETGQRGFLLTGEDRYLDPYNRAIQQIPPELSAMSRLIAARPGQSATAARLNALITDKLAELRATIELWRTRGIAPPLAIVLSDRGKQTLDEIRALCGQIRRTEVSDESVAASEGEAAAGTALLATIAGSLVLLFLFAFGLEPFASPDPQAQRRSWPLRYGVAVLTVVMIVLFRAALTPLMGGRSMPFTLFFPAVWFAAWFGGVRPGALSVLLSALAGDYFFAEPTHTLLMQYHDDQVALLMLILVGFGMALLSRSQQQAVLRAMLAGNAERNQRQRYETTLASIGDAVIATDSHGRVTFANRIALSLLRWPQTEVIGHPLDATFRIVNEFTRATVESPVPRVLREGNIAGLANHTVLIGRDGSEVPIDDSAAPIRDIDGSVGGAVLVFRDITERRRAEATTRLLASIVESSDDAILSEDMNGMITTWNQGAQRMFGYSESEVLAKSISILAAPTGPADSPELLERIKRGEHVEHYQTVRRTKTGELIQVSITMSPVRDAGGRITGISKITRDMTAWIEARREIAEQRERLQVTLSSIGDGVIATDVNSCVSYLNPVAEALIGWHTAHAVGRRLDEVFRIINEASRQAVESPVTRVLRDGKIAGLANHTLLITRDGRELAIDDSAAPIRDGRGETIGAVLVFRDVTQRRADEAQLERQAAELRRTNEELSQFAYAISHDLREPLRNIANFTELLVRQYPKPIEGDTRTQVDYVLNGVSRMEALLNDLLTYSQVDGLETRHGLVDTNGVVEKVLADLRSAIVESGAQVTADPLPQVPGYEPQLIQLFQNLIGNAIKYHSVRPLRIHIGAQRVKETWLFSVRDNGIGIAPEYHKMVFGVFKRLHGREIPGTGIGLAICARVTERHGGRIWVESKPGEGSEFFFSVAALPVGAAAGEGSGR